MANERDPELSESSAAMQRLQKLAVAGELALGTAHEARNLLTAIVGFAQVARRRADDPAYVAKQLERIERQSLACVELLERFLAPSRAGAYPDEAVDAMEVIELVAESARSQVALQRIKLVIDAEADLPHVRCSREELTQVLLNVLTNALHATPSGGTVTITARRSAVALRLSIADTGPGVPPGLEQQIFEPFFTTKPVGQGTGIGLALCRTMLANAGGSIRLESNAGRGATFVIVLPAATETT
jgi:signal transduction histidine kinase